jgi:hypothetical protein
VGYVECAKDVEVWKNINSLGDYVVLASLEATIFQESIMVFVIFGVKF